MNDNTVKLKLPGRDEWIQVAWNSQVEIISHRVPVAPLYSYRWEVDGENCDGFQSGHVFQALRADDPKGQVGEA